MAFLDRDERFGVLSKWAPAYQRCRDALQARSTSVDDWSKASQKSRASLVGEGGDSWEFRAAVSDALESFFLGSGPPWPLSIFLNALGGVGC